MSPIYESAGILIDIYPRFFCFDESLSTNLRSDFNTGLWVWVWVSPIYESAGISIDTFPRFFCFDEPLSTNLRSDFHTGPWAGVWVSSIYESAGILIDTYPRFFRFDEPLSTNLRASQSTHIPDFFALMNPYLQICALIFIQVYGYGSG